jgi:hypothetical protein
MPLFFHKSVGSALPPILPLEYFRIWVRFHGIIHEKSFDFRIIFVNNSVKLHQNSKIFKGVNWGQALLIYEKQRHQVQSL